MSEAGQPPRVLILEPQGLAAAVVVVATDMAIQGVVGVVVVGVAILDADEISKNIYLVSCSVRCL